MPDRTGKCFSPKFTIGKLSFRTQCINDNFRFDEIYFTKMEIYLEHLGKIVIVWAFLGFLYDVFYSDKTIEAIRKIFQDDMFEFVRFNYGHLWYIQNLFLAVAIIMLLLASYLCIGKYRDWIYSCRYGESF